MDYKHHYGTHEKKGRHSFGQGDLSDFGGFTSNDMDAHSYLYGPNEYQAPVYPLYDAHDYLGHDYIHPAHVTHIPDAINAQPPKSKTVDVDDEDKSTKKSKKPKKDKKEKKEKKHKSIEVEIDGFGSDGEGDEIHIDSLMKSIDVAIGRELNHNMGHMMHDAFGNSYLNEVTPLYYYPNGSQKQAMNGYGQMNLESKPTGISSGMMVNAP